MRFTVLTFTLLLLCIASLTAQVSDFNATDFKKADSIARLYPRYPLTKLVELSHKLTHSLATDVEKFRAIYTWTCLNIDNDYSLYVKNKNKREKTQDVAALKVWNKQFNASIFKTLLKEYKTVCTGYAYLVRELALHAGLTCEIVDGYGRTSQANVGGLGIVNHSWNAIQLNNKWYLCDPTWSSGAIDTQNKVFIKNYNDIYFLLDPALFIRNHYPVDKKWLLVEDKPSLQQFLNRPIVYSPSFRYGITELYPETFELMIERGESISLKFTLNEMSTIKKAEILIGKSPSSMRTIPVKMQQQNRLATLQQKFTSKGKFTMHVLLDGDYVFTYRVKVR
jgi:hypothetical protein